MNGGPFIESAAGISLRLQPEERQGLATALTVIDLGGDAGGRLDYLSHPDDAAAEERFRGLVKDDLDRLREEDRALFQQVCSGEPTTAEAIEGFMRVVGEARIILAARLGIEEDGWEFDARPDDPEMALLGWLGYLQDAAVGVLAEGLP